MTKEELKKEITNNYTDYNDYQVTIDKNPGPWSTGNGMMHTGLVMCMYEALGLLNSVDKMKFKTAVSLVQKSPGLYHRNPGRLDQNAHDDLIGIAAGSMVTDSKFHKDIANHGLKNFFIWNNDGELKAQDFLGRHVFYMAYFLSAYLPLFWLTFFKLILVKPKSYKILLNYMIVESIAKIYPSAKTFRNNFVKSTKIAEECARYFGENHPVAKLAEYVEKTEL